MLADSAKSRLDRFKKPNSKKRIKDTKRLRLIRRYRRKGRKTALQRWRRTAHHKALESSKKWSWKMRYEIRSKIPPITDNEDFNKVFKQNLSLLISKII